MKISCDTAQTDLELEECSRIRAEQSVSKHDSLVVQLVRCIDTLSAVDHRQRRQLLKENSMQRFDFWTDYPKIKKLFLQSTRDFKHYADNEMYVEGEFYGLEKKRSLAENVKLKEIYDRRIGDLMIIREKYCR